MLLTAVSVLIYALPAASQQSKSPAVGKYFCFVGNAVGLQTNSQTNNRYAGKIAYPENEKKFFVSIEENKQLAEDHCFSASALDDLKKLRRGETPDRSSKTYFLDNGSFYDACQARYTLKLSGSTMGSQTYYSSGTNIFRDHFSQFWFTNDLSYTWYAQNFSGDHYLTEGRCEKIN
ncbi:hypothetical protein ACVIQT_008006 [Bradyrhizobium diazoefficiens]